MIRSTTFAVVAALAAITLPQTAAAQCIGGGPGGAIPAIGTGGTGAVFPNTLPASPFTQTLAVTVPPGATVLKSVKLNGVTHTWGGDMQFVLENPSGAKFNILCGMNTDPNIDFGGSYEIVDPIALAPSIWSLGSPAPSGAYSQDFGTYTSGTNGISNTAIESIPISSGTWTLYGYDWVGGDLGNVTSWELCFGLPGNAQPPASAPTLLAPIGNVLAIPPVNFSWSTVAGATAFDIEIDGSLTAGVSSPYQVATFPAGAHTWRVRGTNNAGVGPWSALENFQTPPPPPTLNCVPGAAPGAAFPATGAADGIWPTQLPTGGLSSTATIAAPPGATLSGVKLIGFQHTWNTDVVITLTDPSGVEHMILQRDNGSSCGGCSDDFSGDYSISDLPGSLPFPTCGVGTLPQGIYVQDVGLWPTGSSNIFNTPISSIPVTSGNWTLNVYDWCVDFDDGFLTAWELCFAGPAAPVAYCTAGTTTNGCTADIAASANPSVSAANACNITVTDVEGQKSGLIFYSITGQASVAWNASSFLCVKAPTQRTGTQTSGGTVNTCTGTLSLDWNAFQAANPGSLGNPWTAGNQVQVQAWFRDPPAGKATNLSNAIEMTYVP